MITIDHVLEVMEHIAPVSLAETWDNPGLQVGHREWLVNKIWVALDPTYEVVEKACGENVNLLITHHPLIFHPLRRLDMGNNIGKIIELAIKHRVAILCAHTNLDSVSGGLNDMFAERLGLECITVLSPKGDDQFKLVVYVPKEYEDKVLDAIFESGAGKAERYSSVSFRTEGIGTFRAGVDANPFLGRRGEFTQVPEFRIEVLVARKDLSQVTMALTAVHPYEEVVYDVYAISGKGSGDGLGRIGELDEGISLGRFSERIKRIFGLSTVKVAGNLEHSVKRIAVCTGSGRGLLGDFLSSDAEVLVSGDLGYHDGQRVVNAGKGLIDIGHFASEHLVVRGLVKRLKETLSAKEYLVEVASYQDECDCFQYV
ncbi:MAG: Nif3-like dinuclear metal center hexameric protein [Deltaproteobacteria bacterium]|nr:Nif3-like dinuclear metal center hexameric protein [Deltaproteobacteria bacterium]MBW2317151.1 Nif3-like dinuclear metal center hexameric protein [Deltaproteobacteria bacterium]MBW2600936.1 Nif3-like dinuclear metal center hexameric protein [Deltaproteobacteria bacterium]